MIYGKFTDNGKEDLGIMLGFWWFSPTDKKKLFGGRHGNRNGGTIILKPFLIAKLIEITRPTLGSMVEF